MTPFVSRMELEDRGINLKMFHLEILVESTNF
jgi:hypothetical protein